MVVTCVRQSRSDGARRMLWTGVALAGFGVGLAAGAGVASAAPSDDTAHASTSADAAGPAAQRPAATTREDRAERRAAARAAARDARVAAREDAREARQQMRAERSSAAAPQKRRSATSSATPDVEAAAPDLGDIPSRTGVTVSTNTRGAATVIDGHFTDSAVTDATSAAAVLNAAASALGAAAGFADAKAITVSQAGDGDSRETFYRFQQTVDGVAVLGGEVILATDADGVVTGLTNHYVDVPASFDATPANTVRRAIAVRRIARDAYLDTADSRRPFAALPLGTTVSRQLVVVPAGNGAPGLAWQVTVTPPATTRRNLGGATVLIDADGAGAGTVLLTVAGAQPASVTTTAADYRGQTRTITIDQRGSKFFGKQTLVDAGRDLSTYTTTYSFFGMGGPVLPGTVVKRTWKGWNSDAVSAHANAAAVLDYYLDVLGRDSFDGAGIAVKMSINYNPKTSSGGYDNAFWDPEAGQFAFGDAGHLDAALDIVGHEFTHAVVSYVVGDGGSVLDHGESGALNEAFADIMGLLIENKTGADRWLMGEDSGDGAIRNLADPDTITTGLGPYEEDYADRYTGTADDGGEHLNSTIFSHAAYLMMTDPATADITDDEWANVFYRALFRLTPTAVFTDGRAAVISSATALGLDESEIAAITAAFDDVGIVDTSTPVSL